MNTATREQNSTQGTNFGQEPACKRNRKPLAGEGRPGIRQRMGTKPGVAFKKQGTYDSWAKNDIHGRRRRGKTHKKGAAARAGLQYTAESHCNAAGQIILERGGGPCGLGAKVTGPAMAHDRPRVPPPCRSQYPNHGVENLQGRKGRKGGDPKYKGGLTAHANKKQVGGEERDDSFSRS